MSSLPPRGSSRGAGRPTSRRAGGAPSSRAGAAAGSARRPAGSGIRSSPTGSGIRSSPKGSGIRSAPKSSGVRANPALQANDDWADEAASSPSSRGSSAGSRRAPARGGRSGGGGSRRGGRDKKKGGMGAAIGAGVIAILLLVGLKVVCSMGVMTYQDSQFKDEAKKVAQATDDPEYWNFLVDEFHDNALSQCQKFGRGGSSYDPDKYVKIMGDKIGRQINSPDPSLVAKFKARYGRDPHLTDIDESKIPD